MLKRAMILTRKEMHDVFRSRMIKFSFILPALLFGVFIPLLFGFVFSLIGSSPPGDNISSFPFRLPQELFPDITDPFQRFYLGLMYTMVSALLLMLPLFLPLYIAADSFAGERERKTIQQLLATPLTDSEILLGKILTAFIPTIVATYACVLSVTIIINLSWWSLYNQFMLVFPSLTMLIQLVFLYPELAFFTILAVCWVSTRVNKVMEAAQSASFVVAPGLALMAGSFLGLSFNLFFLMTLILVFAGLDYGLFKLASRKFSREALLTKM